MTLLSTLYVCSSCGHQHTRKHRPADTLYRRWVLPCPSRACKNRRRPFYPAFRPITGRYA